MEEAVDSYPGLQEIVREATETVASQSSTEKFASDDLGSNVRNLRRQETVLAEADEKARKPMCPP